MGGQYATGTGGNSSRYFAGVNRKIIPVNIGKHRRTFFPANRSGGSHIRKWRGDDLSFQVQRTDGYLQGNSAIVRKKEMLYTQVIPQFLFQLIYQRSMVGEMPS